MERAGEEMAEIDFMALVKLFSKKQLVSLDSEVEIKLRTRDTTIIAELNNLAQPDKEVNVVIRDAIVEEC